MKISLCSEGTCNPNKCPEIEISENKVVIGEKDNYCVMKKSEFNLLKKKILNGEL